MLQLAHEEVKATDRKDEEEEEQDYDGVLKHRDSLHDRRYDNLQAIDVVHETKWSQHTERTQGCERGAPSANDFQVSCAHAYEIKLVPVGAQIGTLVPDEAQGKDT